MKIRFTAFQRNQKEPSEPEIRENFRLADCWDCFLHQFANWLQKSFPARKPPGTI